MSYNCLQGNYGWVYRGHLSTKKGGPRDGPVAVKTLKVVMGQLDDMEREIEIMKVREIEIMNVSATD